MTTLVSILRYALLGSLRSRYALAFFCVGLVGTYTGQLVVGALLERWRRQSLIIIIISIIIGGSALMMGAVGAYTFADGLANGVREGMHPMCADPFQVV